MFGSMKGWIITKKYKLGKLNVSDKEMQDTKEEIVIELIDYMQKYVMDGNEIYSNADLTYEEKLEAIKDISGRFCGLASFLQFAMGVEVRNEGGPLYAQELSSRFHFWKMSLEISINNEKKNASVERC